LDFKPAGFAGFQTVADKLGEVRQLSEVSLVGDVNNRA
jgi:hypothetical protein